MNHTTTSEQHRLMRYALRYQKEWGPYRDEDDAFETLCELAELELIEMDTDNHKWRLAR